ncbi:MAG: NAD(P)/FAD-dependent oxidoreductase, partial [Fidelibacterota bacterium]
MMESGKIIIAGAGISGLTAAINLARWGRDVVIYEKRIGVGRRFNLDFQFLDNWVFSQDILQFLKHLNVEISFPHFPVFEGYVWDYNLKRYSFKVPVPFMYMVRRGWGEDCLDYHLYRQALKYGVKFIFNKVPMADRVDIFATGPDPKLSTVLVEGISFDTDFDDCVHVLFKNEVSPDGYAYLVIFRGRGIICVPYFKVDGSINYLERAVELFKNLISLNIKDVKYFGNYGIPPLMVKNSRLIVGEAAGFQDVLWGFGMRWAFYSGYLAAECMDKGSDYWKSIRRSILPYVRTSILNRIVYEIVGDIGHRLMVRWLNSSCNLTKRV